MAEPIIVIAHVRLRPEGRNAFADTARACIAAARAEAACLAYDCHESVSEPGHFVFVEQWADRAGLEAHMGMPHVAALVQAAQPHLTEAPRIEAISPAESWRLL